MSVEYEVTGVRVSSDQIGIILHRDDEDGSDGFAVWMSKTDYEALSPEDLDDFLTDEVDSRLDELEIIVEQREEEEAEEETEEEKLKGKKYSRKTKPEPEPEPEPVPEPE